MTQHASAGTSSTSGTANQTVTSASGSDRHFGKFGAGKVPRRQALRLSEAPYVGIFAYFRLHFPF